MDKMPPLPKLPIKPPTSDEEGKLPTRLDPSVINMTVYKGMMFPCVYDPVEVQVQKAKTMDLRDDDVLLCSYPKCGTHWMWRILDMLVSRKAEYSNRAPDFTALDMQSIDLIQNVPSPRVLLTHYPFDYLPEQVEKVKLVHIYRHPKAATVSMYFQMQSVGKVNIPLPQLVQMQMAGKTPYGGNFGYWDKVHEFEKNNPDINICHLAYEDVKKDTAGSIRKLADFLQVQATDELCSQIAEAVSFENQKKKEIEKDDKKIAASFYRKGVVDDWKNYLTVAESEQFDAVMQGRANTCPFSRRYLPSA